ncbi:hypothetical protein J5N97_001906 [Dioscorea zingiberensis]|uniref:S1 motif domain-containing protein n=1 Tax=Dioscorea zingiberensis TaxID=325984 RepID=A0A9D5BTF0_9LILI|nr:hypothetical protein J5N97_001906 [Dioscorea zingiberensis]
MGTSRYWVGKANPEASYMEIEKSFYKNKGKIVEIKEVPFGVPKNAQASKSLEGVDMVRPVPKKVQSSPLDGLNLVRPVPKKGVKFEVDDKPTRKPEPVSVDESREKEQEQSPSNVDRKAIGDMTLLRKPEAESVNGSSENKLEQSSSVDRSVIGDAEMEMWSEEVNNKGSGFTLLEKPKALSIKKRLKGIMRNLSKKNLVLLMILKIMAARDLSGRICCNESNPRRPSLEESRDGLHTKIPCQTDDYPIGLQPHKQSTMVSSKEVIAEDEMSSRSSPVSNVEFSVDAALQGKPKAVEGVPALIHQTEISWDATVDPSSYFKVGQIVEAKVYQLDFALERIFLSLKEIMPDPLMETLESVVGDNKTLDGRLEAAQADTELLAIAVVVFGVWMSTHHDGCRKSLTLPVLAIGAVIFLSTLKKFKLAKLTPIEAGCCRPPSE